MRIFRILLLQLVFIGCISAAKNKEIAEPATPQQLPVNTAGRKVIHVFVALCDNQYQGIVPVPKAIGNGQDPPNNLYWGTAYGVKTFLSKQTDWQKIKDVKTDAVILNRVIFKHKKQDIFLVADAYNGKFIKQCTIDFLNSCAGNRADSFQYDNKTIYSAGSAQLLSYIGHDGLMDFSLANSFAAHDSLKRETIILACISKKYFTPFIKQTNAKPLLWSTGLMSPEAYTLDAAIDGWINKESDGQVRERAAQAYQQYQKCGINAARKLLATGW